MARLIRVKDVGGKVFNGFDGERWETHPILVEEGKCVIYMESPGAICNEEDWGQFSLDQAIEWLKMQGMVHVKYDSFVLPPVPTGEELGTEGDYLRLNELDAPGCE